MAANAENESLPNDTRHHLDDDEALREVFT
jgi:hypothetical protein